MREENGRRPRYDGHASADHRDGAGRERKNYGDRPQYGRENRSQEGGYERRQGNHYGDRRENRYENRTENHYENRGENRYENREHRPFNRDWHGRSDNGERTNYAPRPHHFNNDGEQRHERPFRPYNGDGERRNEGYNRRPRYEGNGQYEQGFRPRRHDGDYDENAKYSQKKQAAYRKNFIDYNAPMRLNRYLANSGICSRREADEFIAAGVVSVNDQIVTELGTKVIPATDKVLFHDQLVRCEKRVYILLNKPKDCVTTVDDPQERTTVLDYVKNACKERVYPVGRLDRNTTGLLLITNDGELASKMTHPKYNQKKIYEAVLDHEMTDEDMQRLRDGVELEDGEIKADSIDYSSEDHRRVGVEIHSGRNRIVRRMFAAVGYKVLHLDRVYLAGLTKKNLPRGKWRFLTEMEVNMLKMSK